MGQFAIPLPAGTYRACFEKLSFGDDVGRRCWGNGYDVFGGTDIVVTEGGTTTITAPLPHDAQVKGRIVGAGGVGVSAYVAPYRRAPDGTWTSVFGEQSIADGSFVVHDLDPGTYRFCLHDVPREYLPECWDDVATLAEAAEVAVTPGSTGPLKFRLAPARQHLGHGDPAARVDCIDRPRRLPVPPRALGAASPTHRPAPTAATGSPASTRIPTGSAPTATTSSRPAGGQGSQVDDATDVVLATGQYRTAASTSPPGGPASSAAPCPTSTSAPRATRASPRGASRTPPGSPWRAATPCPTGIGNDWTYEIGSLPTGTYVVCVEHSDPEFVTAFPRTCNGGSPSPQGGIPFEVVAGATTSGIDIATGQAGEIRGGVLGSSARVRVDLYAPTGRLALSQWTGADGRYRFPELPRGDYRVGFHRATARSSLAAEWWHNRGDGAGLAGATPVTVDGDESSPGSGRPSTPAAPSTVGCSTARETRSVGCAVQARRGTARSPSARRSAERRASSRSAGSAPRRTSCSSRRPAAARRPASTTTPAPSTAPRPGCGTPTTSR